MTRIDLGRGPLEYERIGSGTTRPELVFLHEGLGCVAMWGGFPARLCTAASCAGLVYSRYGYGGSSRAGRDRSARFMHVEALEVLPALLRQLGIASPVFVGQSDGASIALIYAATHPSAVSGLILEAPHVFAEALTVGGVARVCARFGEDPEFRRQLSRYHADAAQVVADWSAVWLAPSFQSWNIEDGLESIGCPILMLQAEGDPYGGLEHLRRIEARVRGPVRSVILPGCGHAPHRDCHARTLREMTEFLDALVPV